MSYQYFSMGKNHGEQLKQPLHTNCVTEQCMQGVRIPTKICGEGKMLTRDRALNKTS